MAPGRLEMAPRTLQILTNRVKKCQTVSKNDGNVRKHNALAECQDVSKRLKKQSPVKTCQNVSKKCQQSVEKVSKTFQNVSKHVKNYRGAVFRVKKSLFVHVLILFLTLDVVF